MLSDDRIDMINKLVSQYLNEDSASCKVGTNHGVEQRFTITPREGWQQQMLVYML